MSNARSPRDVCSTTIGIRGISFLLAAGCPQLLRFRRLFLFLVGRPEPLARFGRLRRDRLDLGGDPVERLAEAQVGPHAVGAAALEERVDVLVRLTLVAQL